MPLTPEEKRAKYKAYYAKNREKRSAYINEWRAKNPVKKYRPTKEVAAEKMRKWREANPDKVRAAWQEANARRKASQPPKEERSARTPEEKAEYGRQWRKENNERYKELKANWKSANPDKVRMSRVNREMTKIKAIPKWAKLEKIAEIYARCRFMTEITGDVYHVDHIVPLRSPLVCGLHCEQNLRVIPGLENSTKSNFHWPDMP